MKRAIKVQKTLNHMKKMLNLAQNKRNANLNTLKYHFLPIMLTETHFDNICYAKSLQSCPTLCDPIDGSPPGSPIPGILQARTLEWAAISFSNA